jgi:hypothetical protein
MIFIGQNEADEQREMYTFKLIGGEKSPEDEEDEGEDGASREEEENE